MITKVAMAERYRDSINLPIAVPAWALVSMLGSAIFTAGMLWQKLDMLIENSKKSETSISVVQERQIIDRAALNALQAQQMNQENRISTLERAGSVRAFK